MLRNNIPLPFFVVIGIILALFAVMPWSHGFAVHASAPWYTYFIYMFGHASFLHCLVNAWCLLTLVNVLSPWRCLCAYVSSVLLAVAVFSQPFAPSRPVLGLSVVIFYFYGYITRHLWRTNIFTLLSFIPVLALGFFFPHIASGFHLLSFCIGFLAWHIELAAVRIRSFLFA